jgi:hypothetical protein
MSHIPYYGEEDGILASPKTTKDQNVFMRLLNYLTKVHKRKAGI